MSRRARLSTAGVRLLALAGALAPAHTGLQATASAAEAPPATGVLTENVRSNPTMPQPAVVDDVRTGASLGAVVLWQEMAPARYKSAVHGLRRPWRTVQAGTENPISYDAREWRLVSSHHELLSHGRATVTPDRSVTWAVLRSTRTGRPVAFMNTHYVSSAWDRTVVAHKTWRRHLWNHEWHRQDHVVDRLAQRGLTVLGGGDFNRVHVAPFAGRQRELNSHDVDHLWLVPGTQPVVPTAGGRRHERLHSDHDAVVASVTLG